MAEVKIAFQLIADPTNTSLVPLDERYVRTVESATIGQIIKLMGKLNATKNATKVYLIQEGLRIELKDELMLKDLMLMFWNDGPRKIFYTNDL